MYLWTGGIDPPEEYIELYLCRDVFHCTPDQLPDLGTILRFLTVLGAENHVKAERAKQRK